MTIVIAASQVPLENCVMKEQTGTTDQLKDQHEESTYALLIRSKEKNRDLLELTIHPTLMLGAVLAIWQLVQQPVNIPAAGLERASCVVCVNKSQTLPEDRHPQIKG
jgi:hypothetical protein